jgi:hypothetical protein
MALYEVAVVDRQQYLIQQVLESYNLVEQPSGFLLVIRFDGDVKISIESVCDCCSVATIREEELDKFELIAGRMVHYFTLVDDVMHFDNKTIAIVEDGNGYYPPETTASIERPRIATDQDLDEYSEEE